MVPASTIKMIEAQDDARAAEIARLRALLREAREALTWTINLLPPSLRDAPAATLAKIEKEGL